MKLLTSISIWLCNFFIAGCLLSFFVVLRDINFWVALVLTMIVMMVKDTSLIIWSKLK